MATTSGQDNYEAAATEAIRRSFVMSDSLKAVYPIFRERFSEKVKDMVPCPSHIRVAAAIAVKLQRFAEAIEHVSRAGLEHEAFGFLRSSTENFVNSFYILYAGPKVESRSREDLAEQYLAFAHIQHKKLIKKSPEALHRMIEGGKMSAAECDRLVSSVDCHVKVAKGRFRFDRKTGQWHEKNLEQRFEAVLACMPRYAQKSTRDEQLWLGMKEAITSQNSALHGDSFSDRTFWRQEEGISYLQDIRKCDPQWADASAFQAAMGWCALLDLFGDATLVKTRFYQEVNNRGNALLEALGIKPQKARIVLPPWLC